MEVESSLRTFYVMIWHLPKGWANSVITKYIDSPSPPKLDTMVTLNKN